MLSHPLYEEIILEHAKHRQNFRTLKIPTSTIEKANPVCGDWIVLQLSLRGDVIDDIVFQGGGCAISQASASLMTVKVKGLVVTDASVLMSRFRQMLMENSNAHDHELDELRVLKNVCKYPVRRKCALLAWDALNASLEKVTQKHF